MPGLDELVAINILTESSQVSREGYGTALILSCAASLPTRTKKYTSASALLSDGFTATSPEYLAASRYFGQQPKPASVKLGKRLLKPTQAWKVTPVAANSTVYTLSVDGTAASYTSDADATVAEICAGLKSALDALSKAITVVNATTHITITANVAGAWFRLAPADFNLFAIEQTHADPGIATDMAAILLADPDWYGVIDPWTSPLESAALAAWVESNKKLLLVASQDTAIVASGTSDIASTLKTQAYARTGVVFHPDNGAFIDAAWFGKCLPLDPGSETWAYKTLAGVAVVSLTPAQQGYADGKYANYYVVNGGVNMTWEGKVAANEYIDKIRGCDWLRSDMQANVFSRLVNATGKIPYTDAGVTVVAAAMRTTLGTALSRGFLTSDPPPTITVPKASAVPSDTRMARELSAVEFSGVIAGAIHKLTITGRLTY